ncbi:hypothetical protein [Pseudomonas chlororaphis]|uniref:hypothetical protein n=1 Tax=Pseudomonas chlororaphis TaxID=587753 RepID=UPI001B3014E5|nr:hypothetical protein [Pseudomonas chlororaphis]MBP5060171.1 hypothetical protein [Pseudomonas chlororaphis]MBP5143966.1 hypothetical protein [Pseudomonas chlororaphis]QTT98262.1 hypothetical protein HUT26_02795 [Pseudomonas chlororaphis]
MHIELSPLSHARQVFKEHVPRIFTTLQQACGGDKTAAAGYDGQLRITPSRLASFLAKCGNDDPQASIHLADIPLSQQITGLCEDLYRRILTVCRPWVMVYWRSLRDMIRWQPVSANPLLSHKRIHLEKLAFSLREL